MSGYDRHPDYGGPEPTWRSSVVLGLFLILQIVALGLGIYLAGSWLLSLFSE